MLLVSRHKSRSRIWNLFIAGSQIAAVIPAAACLGRFWWRFDLLSHFRVQYAILFGLTAVFFLVLRRWRLAILPGMIAMAHLPLLLPYYLPVNGATSHDLRVMSGNLYIRNFEFDRFVELVRREKPDIISLFEVGDGWRPTFAALAEEYPYQKVETLSGDDPGGIALLSRLPLRDAKVVHADNDPARWPWIVAGIDVDDVPVEIIALHPLMPMYRTTVQIRNDEMMRLAQFVRGKLKAAIVLTDLNCSPWSWAYAEMARVSGLRDARLGFGIQPSWPSDHWFVRIPIDFCLISSDIEVRNHWIGADIGSDHLPVLADLKVSKR